MRQSDLDELLEDFLPSASGEDLQAIAAWIIAELHRRSATWTAEEIEQAKIRGAELARSIAWE